MAQTTTGKALKLVIGAEKKKRASENRAAMNNDKGAWQSTVPVSADSRVPRRRYSRQHDESDLPPPTNTRRQGTNGEPAVPARRRSR